MKLYNMFELLKSPVGIIQSAVLVLNGEAEAKGSIEYIIKNYPDIEVERIGACFNDVVIYGKESEL